jgi:CRP-like cAMP-binding protein
MHASVQYIFKESKLRREIEKHAQQTEVPPDTVLLKTGQHVKLLSVVLQVQGIVKVVREDKASNELLLCYIKPGES